MSALVVNQKFAGLTTPFKAVHTKRGPGTCYEMNEKGKKVHFVPDDVDYEAKYVKLSKLTEIVVQYHKMFGALTQFQARHIQRLADSEGVTLQYFSKKKHGGKWKKAGNPTWKFTTNYRVILH